MSHKVLKLLAGGRSEVCCCLGCCEAANIVESAPGWPEFCADWHRVQQRKYASIQLLPQSCQHHSMNCFRSHDSMQPVGRHMAAIFCIAASTTGPASKPMAAALLATRASSASALSPKEFQVVGSCCPTTEQLHLICLSERRPKPCRQHGA